MLNVTVHDVEEVFEAVEGCLQILSVWVIHGRVLQQILCVGKIRNNSENNVNSALLLRTDTEHGYMYRYM